MTTRVAGVTRVMVGVISTAPRSTGLSRDLTGTARDPTNCDRVA